MMYLRTKLTCVLALVSLVVGGMVGCEKADAPEEDHREFKPAVVTPDEPADEPQLEADPEVERERVELEEDSAPDEVDQSDQSLALVEQADGVLEMAVDQAREATVRQPRQVQAPPAMPGQSSRKQKKWKSAVLEIVTNFEKADVTVNGLSYPEYVEEGEAGMVLPAGGPHTVEVTYEGKTKTYRIYLRPDETRLLMVELTGFQGSARSSSPRRVSRRPEPSPKQEDKDEEEEGRVTVYAKPKGQILIDGNNAGEETPGTVTVEPGRHEVRVRFEDGQESEKKIIRVRKGSRIKLFFRQKSD